MMNARSVLIIDDDEDIRDMVGLVLSTEGFRIGKAADGIEALEKIRTSPPPPSVVVLDLMMPNMDGTAFLQTLRTDPAMSRIPVVVLSGHHQARDRALELSAKACLVKPVDTDQLIEAVRQHAIPFVESLRDLATRVDLRRRGLGLSQASVAAAAGLQLRRLEAIESAEADPTLLELLDLARVLRITLDELLD